MTYEAHKEYLAKMYEEYQRQEEENIKKGKKGFVSTISGLSAQASGIKGSAELREPDDNSQTPESEKEYESADPHNLLGEGKRSEGAPRGTEGVVDQVRVDVHDLLVDFKAEKVEATEVKLDEMDSEAIEVSENGTLVQMDSLLDNVYCAAVEKLNSNVSSLLDDQKTPPLISLDDEKDTIPNSNSFLFGKVAARIEDKLLSDLSPVEPLVMQHPVHTSTTNELGLLVQMTSSSGLGSLPSILEKEEFEQQPTSHRSSFLEGTKEEASSKIPEDTVDKTACKENASTVKTSSSVNATSNNSERTEKEKKIQTSTTQVSLTPNHQVVR